MAKESALHEAQRRFNEVSQRVRSDGNNWQNFLTCAARNHKYDFREQLLIYDPFYRERHEKCKIIESRW